VAGHVAAVLSMRLGRLVTVDETGLVRRYPNRIRQLRQAKPRPWSQDRLIVAIEQAARELGRPVPTSRRSLKTMVSRWENGRHRITPENRRLLCRALSCRDSDLDDLPLPQCHLVPDRT
jgi:transcriptional regulator with XRE-family HTH domain